MNHCILYSAYNIVKTLVNLHVTTKNAPPILYKVNFFDSLCYCKCCTCNQKFYEVVSDFILHLLNGISYKCKQTYMS